MAHYLNAPIVEAIIDIQVRVPSAPTPDVFKRLSDELTSTFPSSTSINQIHLNIQRVPFRSLLTSALRAFASLGKKMTGFCKFNLGDDL